MSRRRALKRGAVAGGAVAGGALLWVAPAMQTIAIDPSQAQRASGQAERAPDQGHGGSG
ncbi:MAG: twin-arginine translocation signal domain-containing protein [Actinobacteria bacterium]|nr:twin-arginine translocation signal domain-containing protein [Actinomycetota bacterium]